LIPIAQAFQQYANWAIFLCVGFYLLGSSGISLGTLVWFFILNSDCNRLAVREFSALSDFSGFYVSIALAVVYFLCLVLAAVLVPVRKWTNEENDEKKVENQTLLDSEIINVWIHSLLCSITHQLGEWQRESELLRGF
jgi:hypothetical protein